MTIKHIQWFPGHMAKTIRELKEKAKSVDVVVEMVDARSPEASRNPVIDELMPGKPRILFLNKSDLADPFVTDLWCAYYAGQGLHALSSDIVTQKTQKKVHQQISQFIRTRGLTQKYNNRVRLVILGIPNVGKSTLINTLLGRKRAKAEDRPSVTKHQEWIDVGEDLVLLDTPGVLWPKFENQEIGLKLGVINAIKQERLDTEALAYYLCDYLLAHYRKGLTARMNVETLTEDATETLDTFGRKRGIILPNRDPDYQRLYDTFLHEFRAGKFGRITLERPV